MGKLQQLHGSGRSIAMINTLRTNTAQTTIRTTRRHDCNVFCSAFCGAFCSVVFGVLCSAMCSAVCPAVLRCILPRKVSCGVLCGVFCCPLIRLRCALLCALRCDFAMRRIAVATPNKKQRQAYAGEPPRAQASIGPPRSGVILAPFRGASGWQYTAGTYEQYQVYGCSSWVKSHQL